jgi:methionine-gamma-lyase
MLKHDPNVTIRQHLQPESLMMSFGYRSDWSEGSVKCPIFQTSTFAFKTAEDGKAFFEVAYGLREQKPKERLGLIYSRMNNPDLEILENRLCLWDGAEEAAVFASGMAAIATTLLEFVNPGDLVVHSEPVYGGTDHFIKHMLHRLGVATLGFRAGESREELVQKIRESGRADRLAVIYIETPANPTNDLIDMRMCAEVAQEFSTGERRVLSIIDNTFLGPLWSHPLKHGFDLVIYSATKYIGGHSDVIAGVCLGSRELLHRVKSLRTFLGSMSGPWTSWLLLRSLETLKVRMTKQMESACAVATWLTEQPKVAAVHYLGLLRECDPQYAIYRRQCLAPGAMISFDVRGGEPAAFRFLNALQLVKLAVSLGGTESLAEHPSTMTHAGVDAELKRSIGITDGMIRLSIGLEAPEDIMWDIRQALAAV